MDNGHVDNLYDECEDNLQEILNFGVEGLKKLKIPSLPRRRKKVAHEYECKLFLRVIK